MATALNCKRIVLGGILGGLCWNVWSMIINVAILGKQYEAGIAAGHLLAQPRYGFFIGEWILMVFLLSIGLAWIYAASRSTLGPGPGSALKVGVVVGIVSSFPGNFAQAAWSPLPRTLPLWWMMDMLVGTILATLVAGWFYRD